jgi:hypothetical protein
MIKGGVWRNTEVGFKEFKKNLGAWDLMYEIRKINLSFDWFCSDLKTYCFSD